MITRRLLLAATGAAWVVPEAVFAASPAVITMLGDSITAGLGLAAKDALPAQLQDSLNGLGVAAVVRAAGVSGDTTAGALARLDFSVQADTHLCIVELGGNDYLQSVDPRQIRANLTQISKRLKTRGIKVMILGGHVPQAGGGAYSKAFDLAYAGAAKDTGATLLPNFLNGVLDKPGLRQADGIHPNAAGVKILAAQLVTAVVKVLAPGKAR